MLVLPLALLVLGTLLPSALTTAPTGSFTNGHMSPRNRSPAAERGGLPMRGRPARLGTAADAHQEVMAVVEQTTSRAENGMDQFMSEQVTEVVADVVEEPNPMEPTKTHEQLIAEELQKREDELQSRAEEQGRRDAELRLRAKEQERRDAELKRRNDAEALVQLKLEQRPAAEVLHKTADVVEEFNPTEPKSHLQLVAEELQRREEEFQSRAEEQSRRDAELRLRAEEQARRDEVVKQRADAEKLVQQELELRAAFDARQNAAATSASASDPLPDGGHLREPNTGDQEEFFRPQSDGQGGFRPEEQGRRDAELRLQAEEQERRDAELKRRNDAEALVQPKLEQRPAAEVLHKTADVVEEFNPTEPKSHLQLVAEELQRREEEFQSRAEEQGRRDAELRLRAEEQARRDEVVKQRADAEKLVQQELELRAAFDARQNAAATSASASDPLPDGGHLREPNTGDQEEFFRPQSRGRGGFRPSRFHVDETLPEDARNKRHEELELNNQNQTFDDIELRKQDEARRHTENLSRQEEIEIDHLEAGLAHETNGTDQHQREAYEHDLINQEREDMINKQEIERLRLEKEVERLEEIRKFQDTEKLQREQEVIIKEENQKRHMNINVDTKPRSDAHDWEARNGVNVSSSIGWTLLLCLVLANITSYFDC